MKWILDFNIEKLIVVLVINPLRFPSKNNDAMKNPRSIPGMSKKWYKSMAKINEDTALIITWIEKEEYFFWLLSPKRINEEKVILIISKLTGMFCVKKYAMIAVMTDAKIPKTNDGGNTLSFFDSYTTMVLPKPSMDIANPTFAIDIKNPNSPYSFFVTRDATNIQKIP